MRYDMKLPLSPADMARLRAGDEVRLSGPMYTARDAAHARLIQMLEKGEPLPIPRGACLYYAGPCPAAPGEIIGPCGPTTSKRMDPYTPPLIDYGLTCLIGKGPRSEAVKSAMRGRAVYLAATGGAGMLYASRVKACAPVALEELGPEAIYALMVEDFPATVACDVRGRDVYGR